MKAGESGGRRGERTAAFVVVAVVVTAALVPWFGAGVVGAASCTTVNAGYTITQSGCYVLEGGQPDGDEEDSDASRFVEVQASDVVIDGNGNTIDGTGSGEAVYVDGPYSNVTVRNVTLTDWATGVYVKGADSVALEDVTVRSSDTGVTMDTTTNSTVGQVTASNNTNYGVYLKASPGGALSNVTAAENTKSNVLVEDSDGATVKDSTFTGGGAHGLFVKNSPNVSVGGVVADNSSTDGIHLYSNRNTTVRHATVRYAGQHGLYAENSPNVTVVGITVEDPVLDGIHVGSSDDAVVRDSAARRAGQHGVYVGDANGDALIRSTTATNSTGHGFRVHHSDGSTLAENTARDNGAAGVRISSELATVRDNLFERNAVGIYLYKHSHTVENNTVRANGYGVTLDGDNTTIARNRVVDSTTAGFHYVSGKNDLVYDNLFNNTANTEFDTDPDPSNRWNVSARAATNVLGGPVVAGNAWFDPAGDGHSELWNDADGDGITDTNYTVNATNVDELPLNAVDALSVTPASHDYGDVNLSSSVTKEFLVESHARPNVTVDRLSIEGLNALMFALESDPTPVTLSTGETVSVNVTFDPTVTGLLSANLSVESDTTGVDGVNATLSGEGIDDTDPTAEAGSNRTVDDGTELAFDGTNSTDDVGIVSYAWDFGDGNTSTGATPTHTYASVGTYTVTLNVSDAAGNSAADTLAVTVESSGSSDGDGGGGDDGGSSGGGGGGPIGDEPTGELTITERTLLNGTVDTGEPVVVRVGLANFDPARGSIALSLAANGTVVAEREVAVGADGARTVYLETSFDEPGRYPLAVNGVSVDGVEVIEGPGSDPTGDGTDDEPVPSAPGDLEITVEGDDESSADVAVRNAEPNRSVPVEFGDAEPSTDDVSFESISFTPTEGEPITMNVTASDGPLAGSPEFDRADNTSRLAHLRVEHSIANADVDGALVRFGVSAARLERLETAPDDVALYRYEDGSWTELETRVLRETDEGYVFVAKSPGLSEFAAGAKQPQFELRTARVAVDRIRVGDEVRVRVRITNTGGADGTYTAKLLLDDEVVSERRLTIAANGTRQVLFSHEIAEPGDYRVLVNGFPAGSVEVSNGVAGNGTVAVEGSSAGGLGIGSPLALGAGTLSALVLAVGGLYRRRTDD